MFNIDMKVKIRDFFNEVFDMQILKYTKLIKDNKNIPKESIIFLESANNSINNCINLINKNEYIDSLCLLRSSFEAIMFALAINFDEKTYNVYKCYNYNIYNKVLMDKYKKEKKKNPKFPIPDIDKKKKDSLQPKNIRKIVSKNYKHIFNDLFFDCENEEDVENELGNFYQYLCNFTHPSIVKTYVYKIQNDNNSLDNIRAVFKLNINYCKILLLLSLNYFTQKDDMNDIYDLYAILFLLDINLIDNVDNLKILLKKYDEYLYLNMTRKYFKSNSEKMKDLQKKIRELSELEDISEKLVGTMENIVIKFNAIEFWNEYFQINN